MSFLLDIASGLFGSQHAADPAQIAVPAGGVTGPGLPAPAAPQTDAGAQGYLGHMLGDFASGIAREGLGGLFDITGMMDRQEAQRELAGNFQIIDPANPPAHRAGNQITQEEFEKTARLYSDIRLDRTNMHFDLEHGTNPLTDDKKEDQFKRDFMGNIGRILQTEDGREMIDGIAHNEKGHRVDIQFNPDMNSQSGEPTNVEDAANKDKGSDSVVRIDPSKNGKVGQPGDAWRDMRSDVTLFHELAHTYHQVTGTEDHSGIVSGSDRDLDNWAGLEGSDRWEGSWEQQAVGVGEHANDKLTENRYRAQRAEIGASGKGVVAGDVGMAHRDSYA